MLAVDDLLVTMRLEESHYAELRARSPWTVTFRARDRARLVLVTRGSCRLSGAELDRPRPLPAGSCFLARAGVGFALHDTLRPDPLGHDADTARGTVGGDGELTEIVSTHFTFDAVAAEALFALLPPLYPIDLDAESGHLLRATFDLVAEETRRAGLGSAFVASRLSDVLFVQALRACCTDVGEGSVGWLAGLRDPLLAPALTALHRDLARPWTLETLARVAGMSRSAFAESFRERTGTTVLEYLSTWRMYRAKLLLRDTDRTVEEIAPAVGYATGAALTRAFTRREGTAPGQWRRSAVRPRDPGPVVRPGR